MNAAILSAVVLDVYRPIVSIVRNNSGQNSRL
jgi:hypothetical protein